jgi:hypothetical protein
MGGADDTARTSDPFYVFRADAAVTGYSSDGGSRWTLRRKARGGRRQRTGF